MIQYLFFKENNFLLIDEPTNNLDINAKKYPVELSKGNNKKYTDLEKK